MASRLVGFLKKFPRLYALFKWPYCQFRRIAGAVRWRRLAGSKRIKLELGSGPKKGLDGWTTVDLSGADICHDLRKGIPLKEGVVDTIYVSHVLEHMPYKQLVEFVRECKRVLKVGGQLSVCVPNARFYIAAYVDRRNFIERESMFQPAIIDTGSFLDQVNYIAYMGGHHAYMFDEENLVNTLKACGFDNVTLRKFDDALDQQGRDFESIYALAAK